MSRILIYFISVSILSITNGFSFSQQNSPTYASQAGANQQYTQQQGNNNNVPNWQTQLNNQNNNNSNNNPQNGYYSSSQNNNPNNNVNVNNNTNNPFLKNTIRRNEKFSAIVYGVDKKGKLYKRTLGYKTDNNDRFTTPDPYLKKSIVIFFGDWCPNCAKFLSSLSRNNCQYIKDLISSGIRIILVSVPSIERIQNWHKPSKADYDEANNKLRSFGIDLVQLDPSSYDSTGNPKKKKNKKVELLLLGDSYSLSDNDIDSLPVMIAIHNSIEQFRGGSDNSLDVVNFENPVALQQFKAIWNEEEEDDDDDDYEDDEYEVDKSKDGIAKNSEQNEEEDDEEDDNIEYELPKKKCNCNKRKCQCNKKQIVIKAKKKETNKCKCNSNKRNNTKKNKNVYSNRSTNDIQMDNFYTEMLNKGCHCVFGNNKTPIPRRRKVIKTTTPVVIQKDYADEDFIEEEVHVKKTNRKCIKQTPRPVCKTAKLQRTRKKIRTKIERAIEKREQRSCDCSRRN